MRKLLNKPWFVGLLALAAAVFVWQSLTERPARRAAASHMGDTPSDEPPEQAEDGSPVAAGSPAEIVRAMVFPERLPDPFAPRRQRRTEEPTATEAAPSETETVHLSAVWEQDGTTFVVLNGRICRPGDVIGRVTIESADRDGVWLTHWKGRDYLHLGQDFTLVTPAAPAATQNPSSHEG